MNIEVLSELTPEAAKIRSDVFMDEQGVFRSTLLNPYFLATILTIVIAYKVRHTLLTIILSLACFYGLVFWLN